MAGKSKITAPPQSPAAQKQRHKIVDRLAREATATGPSGPQRSKLRVPKKGVAFRFMGTTGPVILLSHGNDGLCLEIRSPKVGTVLEVSAAEVDTIRDFIVAAARTLWGAELAADLDLPSFDPVELEDERVPCPHCGKRPDLPCCEPKPKLSTMTNVQKRERLEEERIERVADAIMLDEQEVARMLGLAYRTVRDWRFKGKGPPYVKFGQTVRYRLKDIEKLVADELVDPMSGARFVDVHGDVPDRVQMGFFADPERKQDGFVIDDSHKDDPD